MRASKRNPLPNAPLELSDPITLPEGDVPGAEILSELGPEHAVLLFNVLRIANAWAADGGLTGWYDARLLRSWEEATLTSGFDEQLRNAVGALLGELVTPETADPDLLSRCCLQLSEWALERNAEKTSLTFSQTASLVWPANGRLAYLTGRRLGAACRFKEADLWLRRSARLARWYSDWEAYAHALTSLGMLAYRQGSFPRSRAYLGRALRVAGRHGLRVLEGEIYHDRFTVAFTSGEEGAEDLARAAYERYLPAHDRLPALAYDIAYYWLTKGHATRALHVLPSLLPYFEDPHPRFQVYAACARAAGVLGDHTTYQSMWANAMEIFSSVRERTALAAAILDLGYGAAQLAEWDHAEEAFRHAEEVARATAHAEDLLLAETALASVRERKNPDPIKLVRVRIGNGDLSRSLAAQLAAVAST